MTRDRYAMRRARSDRNSELLDAARVTADGRVYLLGYLLASIPTTDLQRALTSLAEQPAEWGYTYQQETDR
jgi:hypothetical protein